MYCSETSVISTETSVLTWLRQLTTFFNSFTMHNYDINNLEFKRTHLSGEAKGFEISRWQWHGNVFKDTEKAFLIYSVLSVTRIKTGERILK